MVVIKEMESYDEEALHRVKWDVSTWFLMSSIYPIVGIAMIYLIFVTVVGPKFTRNRRPMNLSTTMMIYNTAHVAFSLWWLFKMMTNGRAVSYIVKSVMDPTDFKPDEKLEKQIDELTYYYLISKYVELLDTVFFVFRQKWSQVTFLHVYHHANMAVATWIYLKYIWGRHIIVISILNTFVHAVMYSYYLLSALGPAVKPYLWWKRYITRLQLGQFLFLLVYVTALVYNKCPVQKSFVYFTYFNVTSFLLLFINFYRKAYSTGRSEKKRSFEKQTTIKDDRNKLESERNGHFNNDKTKMALNQETNKTDKPQTVDSHLKRA